MQGGLIPAYGDSFLCRPGSASETGFMIADCRVALLLAKMDSRHCEPLLRGDLLLIGLIGDLTVMRLSLP